MKDKDMKKFQILFYINYIFYIIILFIRLVFLLLNFNGVIFHIVNTLAISMTFICIILGISLFIIKYYK